MEQKIQNRRWLQILVLALVLLAVLLIFKSEFINKLAMQNNKQGDLANMIGLKGTSPEQLKTYQSVTGVLDIQYWVTDRGVRVYFVQVPTLPMVDIELVFDAGAARNGNKGGLAYLTNLLIAEGTPELTADQVAENFDNVGAQFHADSQRDMSILKLRSLSSPEQLLPAIKTFAAILSHPTFPENGFKREQQNAITTLKHQAQLPQYVASRAFYSSLYGNQPYANWVLGDEASVKALTVEDVKAFYQKYYVAKNVVVTIVGDLSAQDANALAQTLTAGLPEGEKAQALPEVPDISQKLSKKMDFPSAQTHILMGMPGLKREDQDYYSLYVGNHILGGNGSVTRIFNTIRNQHGLAYSAYSYFLPMRERGPFVLGCQTRNDQAEKSQTLMEALLKEFVEKGPTEEELKQAKQNLLGGYALQFDSNASICREVAALGFYGLPLNHFNEFKTKVENLTVEDIKQAFQKRINPEKVVIVTVGGSPQVSGPEAPANDSRPSRDDTHHSPGAPKI